MTDASSPTPPVPAAASSGTGDPLIDRYAGREIAAVLAPGRRYRLWRDVWIAMAEAERAAGVAIPDGAVEEMRAARDEIPFERVREIERRTRHDVVAHIHAFGEQCPTAAPVIHLGATSCDVTDNGDLIQWREALGVIRRRATHAVRALRDLAEREAARPCLGYTHYQPAQPTTLGKRAAMWLQELLVATEEVDRLARELPIRGLKGATGTQASFLALLDGDADRVVALERDFAQRLGFDAVLPVSGQTYPRSIDARIVAALGRLADACAKGATDVRLLAHDGEVEEPQGAGQVGSSAMPYKRNPMKCERICSLARLVRAQATATSETAAVQWLERSLDDSAYRRIGMPQAFLATDGILGLWITVARGLIVWPKVMDRRLRDSVPFLVVEEVLAACVKAGGDRQALHERIREHSRAALVVVRDEGRPNDLLERLAGDDAFAAAAERIAAVAADPVALTGLARIQTERFVRDVVDPALQRLGDDGGGDTDLPEV